MSTIPPFSTNTHNPLLMKDDIGFGKPTIFNLPKGEFIYGKHLTRDKEGAKEVSMTWKFHQDSGDREPSRDFTVLNKQSLLSGLHKSSQVSDFRKSHDARIAVKKGQNSLPIELPEENFRYGRKNRYKIYEIERPSTPMKLVMGNSYGLEAEEHQLHNYKKRSESLVRNKFHNQQVKNVSSVRANKASHLFAQSNLKKLSTISENLEKVPFKLSKFRTIEPRTNTNLKNKEKSPQNQVQVEGTLKEQVNPKI